MVDAPYCRSCDGTDDPKFCTCDKPKRPFIGRTEIAGKSMNCVSCGRGTLEPIEEQCENCFDMLKIQPLLKLRELTLKEVARIDALLTTKLEKRAKNSRHNLNLAFNCVCGTRFKTGLDLIAHLAECEGPTKTQTARSANHAKMMNIDLSHVTEIG